VTALLLQFRVSMVTQRKRARGSRTLAVLHDPSIWQLAAHVSCALSSLVCCAPVF
jgi:hypothetical protein